MILLSSAFCEIDDPSFRIDKIASSTWLLITTFSEEVGEMLVSFFGKLM